MGKGCEPVRGVRRRSRPMSLAAAAISPAPCRTSLAFALDCCDPEAMGIVATTGGLGGDEVRDLMLAAVEYRFGRIDRLP